MSASDEKEREQSVGSRCGGQAGNWRKGYVSLLLYSDLR